MDSIQYLQNIEYLTKDGCSKADWIVEQCYEWDSKEQ